MWTQSHWLAVNFIRDVSDDAGTTDTLSFGVLLVSKGGAVTLMRSDRQGCCSPPVRSFVSGRLEEGDLGRLRQALSSALAEPAVDCFVPAANDPRPGFSTSGGSGLNVYNGGAAPVQFNIQHSDPDVPVPQCTRASAHLELVLISLEDALRWGAPPLQCIPYHARTADP